MRRDIFIFAHTIIFYFIDKALADLDLQISIYPKLLHGYFKRQDCYASKGELDKAIADLTSITFVGWLLVG